MAQFHVLESLLRTKPESSTTLATWHSLYMYEDTADPCEQRVLTVVVCEGAQDEGKRDIPTLQGPKRAVGEGSLHFGDRIVDRNAEPSFRISTPKILAAAIAPYSLAPARVTLKGRTWSEYQGAATVFRLEMSVTTLSSLSMVSPIEGPTERVIELW